MNQKRNPINELINCIITSQVKVCLLRLINERGGRRTIYTPLTNCSDSVVFLFGIVSVKFNSIPSGSTTTSCLTSFTVYCLI